MLRALALLALIPLAAYASETDDKAKQEESKHLSCLEFAMSGGHMAVPYLYRECMYEQQGPQQPKAKTYCSERRPENTPWCWRK